MILTEELKQILNLGIALTSEKDYSKLLGRILKESMDITNCKGGILYAKKDNSLISVIKRYEGIQTLAWNKLVSAYSMNGDITSVKPDVCQYAAKFGKVVNIPDIDAEEEFDFTNIREQDKENGFHTTSVLIIPLMNRDRETLGVIQLMNAKDSRLNGAVPFEKKYEYIVYSLASQAAVTLDNMNYMAQMKQLLYSIVSVFTAAIDERSPYNANHTNNVAKYAGDLIDYININYKEGKTKLVYSEKQKEQVVMAALLHDIGKLTTPIEIMNKSTRLGSKLVEIVRRFELIECKLKIDYLEHRISRQDWKDKADYLKKARELVKNVNAMPHMNEETLYAIEDLAKHKYKGQNGQIIPYITMEEAESLSIVKGTLTKKERAVMEEHVVITKKLLSKISFSTDYKEVPVIAGAHHEFLDGSGYPMHLSGSEIPKDTRILTVLDIFDSLISADRPYKQPIPIDQALDTLDDMVREGKLDKEIVSLLRGLAEEKYKNTTIV